MATPPKKKRRTESQTPPMATSTPARGDDCSGDNFSSEEFLTPTTSQEQQLISSAKSLTLTETTLINAPSLSNGGNVLTDSSNNQLISPATRHAIFEGIMSLSSTGAETTLPGFDAAVYDAVFEHELLSVDQVRSFYASLAALVQLAKSKERDFRLLVAEANKRGSVGAVASALDAGHL